MNMMERRRLKGWGAADEGGRGGGAEICQGPGYHPARGRGAPRIQRMWSHENEVLAGALRMKALINLLSHPT